jgi:hypothetical protein
VGNIDSKGESGNGARGVAVAGRYAYLADATAGLQIIDVADPANPARLASVSAGLAWDVAVRGNYAFVADNKAGYVGSEGIVIVDVSNPARPVRIGNYATVPEPWNVLMVSNTLFACTLRLIEALDVTDPLRPRSLGAYRPILGDGSIEAIWGGYMMVSSGFEGLELVDVRDPTSLSHLGFLDMSGSGEGVAASGGLAFLADGQTLYIIDVRDPTQPTLVGQLALGAPMRRVVLSG